MKRTKYSIYGAIPKEATPGADALEELKNKKLWVVWKKAPSKTPGRTEKIPYSAINPKLSWIKREAWEIWANAKQSQIEGKYDGVGLCFDKIGYTFIDIDHCINEKGELNATAQELTELFKDCYIEKSQSGEGLHIIAKGQAPGNIKVERLGLEIYVSSRYCAITEDVYNDKRPKEATKRLEALFYRHRPKEEPKRRVKEPQRAKGRALDVIEAINKSKYKEKFNKLYKTGNYKEQYETPSQGYQAFIVILRRFTSDFDNISEIVKASYFKDTKHATEDKTRLAIEKAEKWINGQIKGVKTCNSDFKNQENRTATNTKGVKMWRA